MEPASIDEAKEILYGHPLQSFIAERDALVKQIRSAGDRDLANKVKTLRKPSAVAAAVNQIVRADPAGTELILQAAALLRAAQVGALDGSTINAAELQQQYRAAIKALSQQATGRQPEVRAALEAATIDEASNNDLRTGCLVVVPTPTSLFGTAPMTEPDQSSPVDELQQRRERRQSSTTTTAKAALRDQSAQLAADDDTKQRAAAEAEAARQAEAQRKREAKERARKLKALKASHRDALRTHLGALDSEEAAAVAVEAAELVLADADAEQRSLEQALAELRERRAEAERTRANSIVAKEQAHELAEQTEAQVEALADAIAAIEDEI